jgi:hypothetical protein
MRHEHRLNVAGRLPSLTQELRPAMERRDRRRTGRATSRGVSIRRSVSIRVMEDDRSRFISCVALASVIDRETDGYRSAR